MASLSRSSLFHNPIAEQAERLSSGETGARLLCFGIPVLIAVEIPGLGTIYLAELCLIGLLPVLLVMRGKALQSGPLGIILALGLVYFGAQVITDLIRETPFGDYARGWSRILFLFLSFVSCYLLIGGSRARIICYACGLATGSILYLVMQNPLGDIGWKFGFAGPATTLLLLSFVLLPILRSPSSLIGPMILVPLGIFSAFMDFRSWGGVLMISAAFLSVPAVLRLVGLKPKPLSYGRMLIVGVLLAATGVGALKAYGSAAQSGLLGEKSKAKYEVQSALGDIGILLGGRNESLVTVQAIMDSPLIGHGSWAKDRYYAELKQLMLYKLGFSNRFIEPENDLIPTHSHLLGAWVEAGLGGAIFWFGILMMIAAALRKLYASADPLRPYLVFLMFLFIWDILFSPFGAQRRLTNGFLLVTMLYALGASTLGLRGRFARAMPGPAHEGWAASIARPIDHRAAFGLGEPEHPAWQMPAGRNEDLRSGDHPRSSDDRTEDDYLDNSEDGIDDADIGDGGEGDDVRAGSTEVGSGLTDVRAEPTDVGAGGETIRAGFRQIRLRNP